MAATSFDREGLVEKLVDELAPAFSQAIAKVLKSHLYNALGAAIDFGKEEQRKQDEEGRRLIVEKQRELLEMINKVEPASGTSAPVIKWQRSNEEGRPKHPPIKCIFPSCKRPGVKALNLFCKQHAEELKPKEKGQYVVAHREYRKELLAKRKRDMRAAAKKSEARKA